MEKVIEHLDAIKELTIDLQRSGLISMTRMWEIVDEAVAAKDLLVPLQKNVKKC